MTDERDEVSELRESLRTERASSAHWQSIAQRERSELDALRRRPLVRALLALERRVAPLRAPLTAARRAFARSRARAALLLASLPRWPSRPRRRRSVQARSSHALRGARAASPVTIVVWGEGAVHLDPTTSRAAEVVVIDDPPSADRTERIARAIAESDHEDVCVVAASCEPQGTGWLPHLIAERDRAGAGAATAVLVHPGRPLRQATPHDLAVRASGLELRAIEGAPTARARDAGSALDSTSSTGAVDAALASCIVVRRDDVVAVGGLPPIADVDAAMVSVCARMTETGRPTIAVQDVLAVEHRSVGSLSELTVPIPPDSASWRAVVERDGPLLRRRADADARMHIALTIAAPSMKVASRWGDWHLATALARALDRAGCATLVQTHDAADSLAGRSADVHLVVRGLERVRRTPGQRHVLWIISHPESVERDEIDEADLVLVASSRFAAELQTQTDTPVEVMLQATDHHRFRPLPPRERYRHDVAIVAKSRGVTRRVVADAIAVGLEPAVFGTGWEGLVDASVLRGGYVPNEELPELYSSVRVLLNDHWDTMRTGGFVSNRIFDALGCATNVVSDHLTEIEEIFGDTVATYETPDELSRAVADLLGDPERADALASRGRAIVLDAHTFDHRATQLLELLSPAEGH